MRSHKSFNTNNFGTTYRNNGLKIDANAVILDKFRDHNAFLFWRETYYNTHEFSMLIKKKAEESLNEMKKDAFLDGYHAPFIKKFFKGKSSIGRACGGKFDDGDTCALFAIFLIKLCSRRTIGKDALDLALG